MTSSPQNPTQLTDKDLAFLNSIFDLARNNKPLGLSSLLNQGIPVNLTNANGDTLLILATYHQSTETVDVLLNAGADINAINDRGQTALVCAVFRNNLHLAKKLLAAGADPELGHQTPQQVAEFFTLTEMKKLLTNHASTAETATTPPTTNTQN